MTTTPREWLSVGEQYTGPDHRPAIERAIDALTWQDVPEDGVISGPMSPVLTLGAVIEQLALPRVSAFAFGGALLYPDGPETAHYQLLAVEANYTDGRCRLYLLDTGIGAMPLASDFTPTP